MESGTIVWRDLTVPNAAEIRDFYTQVVGWQARPHPMGTYDDYDILPAEGEETIAGICHARDSNANLPAQWLLYVAVEDVEQSIARCTALGGRVVDGPRQMGQHRFCVIQDPAGAVIALIDEQVA